MKKVKLILSTAVLLAIFINSTLVHGADLFDVNTMHDQQSEIFPIILCLDGQEIFSDVDPVMANDRTFVPARAFFEKLGAEVTWVQETNSAHFNYNDKTITVQNNSDILTINNQQIKMDVPAVIVDDRFLVPVRFIAENLGFTVNWLGEMKLVNIDTSKGSISGVNYGNDGYIGVTQIQTSNYKEYNVRYDGNGTITLNIKNSALAKSFQSGYIDNDNIALTGAENTDFGVSFTFRIKDGYNYNVTNEKDKIFINTYKLPDVKLNYSYSGNRVYLRLAGEALTDENDGDIKKYSVWASNDNKIYSITYTPKTTAVIPGVYYINDRFVSYIYVTKLSKGRISITFMAKDSFVYNTNYRTMSNDSAITLLKPYTDNSKTVFIDVGHGGEDPGAFYTDKKIDMKEKDINLDIAKRLNVLLRKNNINTYLVRDDDTFVGLYERANIANTINSKVFVSIHNNAGSSAANGTETLYYPVQSSKNLAQILQSSLINTAGLYNRNILARDDLVVLKDTKMPAVITETGFITNSKDRAKLDDPDFRQKAAEAMCKGILEYLNN